MSIHEAAALVAAKVQERAVYVRDWFHAQRDGQTVFAYRAQMRRADNARIEGTTVDVALAQDTPEAAIQLAGQRDAFVRRIDDLRARQTLTRPESLELFHLAESVKRIDAATFGAGVLTERRLSEFGEVGSAAPRGFLGPLAGMVGAGLWRTAAIGAGVLAALGWGSAAITGLELKHVRHERDEAQADLVQATREMFARTAERDALAENARAAAAQAAQTAATIEAERRRRAQTEAELRRLRHAEDEARRSGALDYGLGGVQPPGDATGAGSDPGPAAPGAQ